MNIQEETLPQSQVSLTIERPNEDLQPFLEQAATRLSAKSPLAGFRPGKAPYEVSKSRFGEEALYQEALQDVIMTSLSEAIKEQAIAFIGQPQIDIETYTASQPLKFKAILTLMPTVKVGDWQNLKVEKKIASITEDELMKAIQRFADWQAKEAAIDRPAKLQDKAIINFEVSVDNVVIEGGKADKYPLLLGSATMIPGMEEQIIGMKAGEKKEFDLTFPDPYYQPHLAGKPAHFKVEMVTVMERLLPEMTEDWAKEMSGKSMADWKEELKKSLLQEQQLDLDRRWEQDSIEKIISLSTFSPIPELLIKDETAKMVRELQQSVEQRNLSWSDYLQSLKKDETQLKTDFKPQAEIRVKAALILRQLAQDQVVKVTTEEVDAALALERERYKDNAEIMKILTGHDYRHYLENTLAHQKVMQIITEKLAK